MDTQKYDCTLRDFEIRARIVEAIANHLEPFIGDFREDGLKGTSYDLHAGDRLYSATTEKGKYNTALPVPLTSITNLGRRGFVMEPGQHVVIRSNEIIHMPNDMVGRLSLRVTWALRGLGYQTGIIDPGYWGYLFIALVNESDGYLEIPIKDADDTAIGREDALVSLQLSYLSGAVENPLRPQYPQIDLPEDRVPLPPRAGIHSPVFIGQQIDRLDETTKALSNEVEHIQQQWNGLQEAVKKEADERYEFMRREAQAREESFRRVTDERYNSYQQQTRSLQQIVGQGFFAIITGIVAAVGFGMLQYAAGIKGGNTLQTMIELAVVAMFLFVLLTLSFIVGRRYQSTKQ